MTNQTFTSGYALLIGVGADLPVTVQDATALHDVLIDPNRAAYPPTQVILLAEITATRQNILTAFDQIITQVNQNPDATVIIYYSGHGGRIQQKNEYFLVPYGYNPSQHTETAISGLEFTQKIEAIAARKLVVLLDCCHAGGVPALKAPGESFVKSPLPPELLNVLGTGSGRVVVASSREDEYSYTSQPYSAFTDCLLAALQGKASVNKDGFARILDILVYLFDQVPKTASGPQHPFVNKVLDLDDNFPLCYYAGGSKFLPSEILTEIEQVNQTQELSLAPIAAAAGTLSLSAYNLATWVGREALITELTQKLEEKCRILALTGITGIGKTALAERLVVEIHRNGLQFHRLNFDDRGQGTDFMSGALSLLLKLGETVTLEDQKDPQNALKHLLQTLRNNRFLVQIDSVEMLLQGDDESGWNAFVDHLWIEFFQQLLAGGECQSQILLTSQALSEELEIEGSRYPLCWYRQDLGGLSETEQLQLFEKNGLKPDELGKEILKRIGKLYEGHPLVIQVIARDILDKPFYGNVQKYWQRYQAEFDEDERRKKKSTSPRKLQLLVKERVEKSLQRLPSDAYQMLCCSSVYRRLVSERFWLAMLAEDKQDKALELLKSHNLVEEELRGDGILLLRQHNLVREVARSLLRTDAALWRETERTAARLWLNEYEPEPDAANLEKVRGSLEAFHHYCEVEDWEEAKAILIDQGVGNQLHTWSYFQEMLPLYERLLGKLDAALDVVCERGIGNAYLTLSNYPQAIEHYQQSLETAREIGDRQGEGAALGNLGITYRRQGNYPQAIEYFQQHLTITREIGNRQGEGKALGNLGVAYYYQGNYPQAIEYFQQRLIIARENGDRLGEGQSLGNLGVAYNSLGNYPQAIEYHQQHLTIAREISDRLGEGNVLVNWGETLLKLEQYPEAQQHLQTSLEIFKELGDRANEAEALLRLGQLHHKIGQLDRSREFCAQALSLASVLGIPLLKECEELQAMLTVDAAVDMP